MNIELTPDITTADLGLLEELYQESFPAEERRPWNLIVNPAKKRQSEIIRHSCRRPHRRHVDSMDILPICIYRAFGSQS